MDDAGAPVMQAGEMSGIGVDGCAVTRLEDNRRNQGPWTASVSSTWDVDRLVCEMNRRVRASEEDERSDGQWIEEILGLRCDIRAKPDAARCLHFKYDGELLIDVMSHSVIGVWLST